MNEIFDWCVDLLYYLAGMTGLTYKEINVWLFVIIHPLLTLALLIAVILLIRKNRGLKRQLGFSRYQH